ncbi:hypothetical protein TNCT_83201 [Trichonephila clavata]|uniref:Uncharacterized protein n=1 Tax=Trichonephila clavata TaxID=2740835 RepID=A0A8X6F359_TRICU|nr:hypothetical protein TNCT_83201 [Trichonephila clavata]
MKKKVERALTFLKTKGDTVMASLLPTTAFHVSAKLTSGPMKNNHIPFCESAGNWAQECETITGYNTRILKMKSSNRCFLWTNRGHQNDKLFP